MKVSFITTVYNESDTIIPFLESVLNQSQLPDEIIVVDGGSKDSTLSQISKFKSQNPNNKYPDIKVLTKKGNRSVGRNEAISNAKYEIIAISDAGNILDKNWIKNITKPFNHKDIDVVAGYYKGVSKNIFQKCLIPYVLVMQDKINNEEFLPATRSMAIKKSIWQKAGKFDEKLSHNEDYAFANKLKKIGAKIYFAKDALVNWIPRNNLRSAFVMFYRFALGDIEAGILRSKVILLFARYLILVYLLWLSVAYKSLIMILSIAALIVAYLIWAILKNYKYVNDLRAVFILPMIQLTADISVMLGSISGIIKNILAINYVEQIISNKYLSLIIFIYSVIILSGIGWGLPNNQHPFTYHMDEWHFLGALKSVVKFGTAGTAGGAYGPIFYSVINAVFLVPFMLLGIVNPFEVKSSVTQLMVQRHVFEILRLTTLVYGVLSIIFMYKILKQFFTKNWIVGVLVFALNPLFILWSGYYKHEIAVTFWITLSIYLFLKYQKSPNFRNILLSAVASSLALATKLNALPLVGMYFVSFFLFTKNITRKNLRELVIGFLVIIGVFVLLGSPDILFNFDTYVKLLTPALFNGTQNLNLGLSWWQILLYIHYPSVFGFFTNLIFYFSLTFWVILLFYKFMLGKITENKREVFILSSFVLFVLSLLTGELGASNNRVLVVLPFMAIMVSMTFDFFFLKQRLKNIVMFIFIAGFVLQIVQTASWVYLKYQTPIQETSSKWMVNNIKRNTLIGLENIPIYQALPDIVLLEFYESERNPKGRYIFNYEVIGLDTKILPDTIIITEEDLDRKYSIVSLKQNLLKRLNREGYVNIKNFSLDYRFYDYFSDKINLFYWNLVPGPSEISIYKRSK